MSETSKGEDIFIVPAGGYGSRLHPLTQQQAKPSLPLSYEGDSIIRMIDVPLSCIKQLGGTALVSMQYQANSLAFVEQNYPNAVALIDDRPRDMIDTLLLHKQRIRKASRVWFVPADSDVTHDQLESMSNTLEVTGADAVVLGTHHHGNHYLWHTDTEGRLRSKVKDAKKVADLGIHVLQADWLSSRLEALNPIDSHNIWEHIYDYANPHGEILLHVPEIDRPSVDLGTPGKYAAKIRELLADHRDRLGNIIFPNAGVEAGCNNVIALPGSEGQIILNDAILPERTIVNIRSQALNLDAR